MSADIIPFIPRARRDHGQRDISHSFRLPARQADDLAMDHADTAPCEYCQPCDAQRGEDEPA